MNEDEFAKRMAEILGYGPVEPEELAPELAGALRMVDGKQWIDHPACSALYHEEENANFNARLRTWKDCCADKRAKNDWSEYWRCYDKKFWPDAILEMKTKMEGKDWAESVRAAWTESDELWCCSEKWRAVFKHRSDVAMMMTDEERSFLNGLGDSFSVYRGCHKDSIEGLSWTTDAAMADYFAYQIRSHSLRTVVERRANKADVIAFIDPNEEFEVIILPESLAGIISQPGADAAPGVGASG